MQGTLLLPKSNSSSSTWEERSQAEALSNFAENFFLDQFIRHPTRCNNISPMTISSSVITTSSAIIKSQIITLSNLVLPVFLRRALGGQGGSPKCCFGWNPSIIVTQKPMHNFGTLGQLLLGESKDLRRGEKIVPLIVASTFATQPFWGGGG